jgi:hypothetical protein
VRGTLRGQGTRDGLQNVIDILEDVIVPEAQHAIAMLHKPFVANGIAFVDRVLSTFKLDDQSLFTTYEIDDVSSDWLLSNELMTIDLTRAQSIPNA